MRAELLALLNKLKLAEARPGVISSESEYSDDPARVLQSFLEFGGEGWLCLAQTPEILVFPRDAGMVPPDGWPVCGELANGGSSLHISRAGKGWCVSHLTEMPDGDGVVLSRTLLRRGGGGVLSYDVSCAARDLGGLTEWKPEQYRFTGFRG